MSVFFFFFLAYLFVRTENWEYAFLHQRLNSVNKEQLKLDKYWRMLFTWFNMKHKNEWIWFFLSLSKISKLQLQTIVGCEMKLMNTSMRGRTFWTLHNSIKQKEKQINVINEFVICHGRNSVLENSISKFTWFIWVLNETHTLRNVNRQVFENESG